jgi:hypothetical protein
MRQQANGQFTNIKVRRHCNYYTKGIVYLYAS